MVNAPKRIQLSRRKGYRKPEGAVVVARPSRWGNPYSVIPRDASDGRMEAVDLFRGMVESRGETMRKAWLVQLRGRNLACWCKLCPEHADGKPLGVECADCAPCHADVLLAVANQREVANG